MFLRSDHWPLLAQNRIKLLKKKTLRDLHLNSLGAEDFFLFEKRAVLCYNKTLEHVQTIRTDASFGDLSGFEGIELYRENT